MANGRSGLDAADIELALRYLTDFSVVVLAVPADPDIARWLPRPPAGGARLIVVVPVGDPVPDGLPADAIVFEAPDSDPDGVFAAMVGSFAAALDDGGDARLLSRHGRRGRLDTDSGRVTSSAPGE